MLHSSAAISALLETYPTMLIIKALNALLFLKQHKSALPGLDLIAKDFLSIPATRVEV